MKKVFSSVIILILTLILCTGCVHTNAKEGTDLLRLHIRADSNRTCDQQVKLKVRDEITGFLSEKLKNASDKSGAMRIIQTLLPELTIKADRTLKQNGFYYGATVRLTNEFFPTRKYENLVVESGYYDALIVELGSGDGDNWWCVVYPPLCFITEESDGVQYKSKIWELIRQWFGI